MTLVTSTSHLIGAEVLSKLLRHFGTRRQLVALVGELVADEGVDALEFAGFRTIRVPTVAVMQMVPPSLCVAALLPSVADRHSTRTTHVHARDKGTESQAPRAAAWPLDNTTFYKLHVFGLHQDFDKVRWG